MDYKTRNQILQEAQDIQRQIISRDGKMSLNGCYAYEFKLEQLHNDLAHTKLEEQRYIKYGTDN